MNNRNKSKCSNKESNIQKEIKYDDINTEQINLHLNIHLRLTIINTLHAYILDNQNNGIT